MEGHCEDTKDRQAEIATVWSDISDQLARDHGALQEQHTLIMRRWEGVKTWLDCDRMQSENYSRQLKKKDAEIQRLKNRLTGQAKVMQQCPQTSDRSCMGEGEVVTLPDQLGNLADAELRECHNIALISTREEWYKRQTSAMLKKAAADQKRTLLDLEESNACLQRQLSSLTSKLTLVESNFEAAQRRCERAECCAHIIEALNDQKKNAEEHATELQQQLEDVRKHYHDNNTTINQLRQQRRVKKAEHNQQLRLRKDEYCELQRDLEEVMTELKTLRHDLEEVMTERETLRRDLNKEMARSAAQLTEIGALKDKISGLEPENNKLQQQLLASRSEQRYMREHNDDQASRIADMENELAASEEALKNIQLQAGKSCKLRQCSVDLRRLESTPGRFCDPAHLHFQYLTDCGTLLCVDCAPAADDIQMDSFFMGLHFEEDQCPWCRADTWAWQHLEVPYSLAWVQEMNDLWGVIFGSSS